ncbi:Lamin Tail Domain protein [uncultured archaeon]|nr:Lamin Tail Domain protein [uncultured archaeon]
MCQKNKLIVLAVLAALYVGTAFAADDVNSTKSKITINNACFKAASPEKQNLNGEWVDIVNQGSAAQDLGGWTISTQHNRTYAFKNLTLQAGASVKLHTGCGNDTATDIYWNKKMPIWNNNGDMATLKDASGNVVARYPEEIAEA